MSARPTADPKLPIGGDPRVQLLPPSVRARVRAASTRRMLAMLVVLAVVIVGGGYAFAFVRNLTAQQQLDTARQETQAVLAEQAQYSEGSRAAALVAGIQAAQTFATGNEVLWEPLAMEILGFMPEGTGFGQIVALSQAPWEPALVVEGPLRSPRLAIMTITFVSPTVIDAASVVPRLSGLDGYVDARFDSSVWDETRAQYSTLVRVMFDAEAVSGRFAVDSATDIDSDDEGDDQ